MVGRHILVAGLLLLSENIIAQLKPVEGLRKINGTDIFIRTIGKGEPLLIIHGGPGLNHTYFLPHLDALSKKFQLIYYDQRASGRSGIPAPDSVSIRFFVDDIDAIRKEFRLDKINLFAHSWGVIPAIEYALYYPDNVKKMILCNPTPLSTEYNQEIALIQTKRMTRKDSTDRAVILNSEEFRTGQSVAYRRLLYLSFRHSFYKPFNHTKLQFQLQPAFMQASRILYEGLSDDLAKYDYYDRLEEMTIPTLVMYGKADAVPFEAVSRIQQNLKTSTLSVYNLSGHFAYIEEPEKFNKEVTAFLLPTPSKSKTALKK